MSDQDQDNATSATTYTITDAEVEAYLRTLPARTRFGGACDNCPVADALAAKYHEHAGAFAVGFRYFCHQATSQRGEMALPLNYFTGLVTQAVYVKEGKITAAQALRLLKQARARAESEGGE